MSEILVIVAHPNIKNSKVNKALANMVETMPNVTVHYLYDWYPDGVIDIEMEQKLLLDAKHIVLQFPMYWYSTPALLKQWQDAVLTHGFAYGGPEKFLLGKTLSLAVSIGSPLTDYKRGGKQEYPVSELLLPLKQTAMYSSLTYREPFLLGGTLTITDKELVQKSKQYSEYLLDMI